MSDILQIPIDFEDPSFKIRTILEEVEVVLRFDWNSRMELWHISVLDAGELPLLMGLPLYVNRELIGRFKIIGLPAGKLMLYDTSQRVEEAGRYELGQRCILIYQESV